MNVLKELIKLGIDFDKIVALNIVPDNQKHIVFRMGDNVEKLKDKLSALDYDNKTAWYGLHLEGKILMDDGSWYERNTNVMCEWWEHRVPPTIPEVLYFDILIRGRR